MKKLLSVFVAVALVMGFSMTASAADSVNVTLTSPTITKAEDACEKVGAVTFEFGSGAVLEQGDWWYMDLPDGATLCKDIDYVILSDGTGGPGSNDNWVSVDSLDPTLVVFGGGALGLGGGDGTVLDSTVITDGPVTVQQLVAGGGLVDVVGNVAIRVIGDSGTRRVTLYVASDVAGSGSLTVLPNTTMKIKVFDGAHHEGGTGVPENSRIVLDVDGQRFDNFGSAANPSDTGRYLIFGQMDGDATFDPEVDEIIDANKEVPHVENTLCVNAEDAIGNLFVSFASKNDFLTFTGDSQIAHTGGGVSFTLEACSGKEASLDEIELAFQDECIFDYEDSTGYCPTHDDGYIYMQAASTFGEIDERWDIEIEVLTSGVYFGDVPVLRGFLASQDVCEDAGSAFTTGTVYYCAGNDCSDEADSDAEFPKTNSCTVDDDQMIDKIFTKNGGVTGVNNFAQIRFDFDDFHYDTSIVSAGDEVELQVTLDKYPCGTIGTETIVIGTFVTECTTTATGNSSLFFPFLPGSQFVGWWGGYVIANGGTEAGTAMLMATDTEGDSATYTTEEIPAKGQFNASFLEIADWTQSASNAGSFDGTQNYTVFVTCNFNRGSGFAMLGNSTEGVGYTAETSGW